jgi:hypothetical protein
VFVIALGIAALAFRLRPRTLQQQRSTTPDESKPPRKEKYVGFYEDLDEER